MIPKAIHYCWFGGKELPPLAKRCIQSWKKFLPDYDIIEWNERNFDVNQIAYTAEAYAAGKYAFVSDYARFKILHDRGGLYFDTDVELIAPIDDVIAAGPFMAFEKDCCTDEPYAVAPGLGLGAEPGSHVYKSLLDFYADRHFELNPDAVETVVEYTTRVLKNLGLADRPGIQQVEDVKIYPTAWFNPWEWNTGRPHPGPDTRSIHWYAMTWMTPRMLFVQRMKYAANRLLGRRAVAAIKRLLK